MSVMMDIKVSGLKVATVDTKLPEPLIPGPVDLVEKGLSKAGEAAGDAAADVSNEIALWILQGLGDAFKALGHWLLQVTPDVAILIGMIFCLGAICSIPRCGKYAVISLIVGVVVDVVRRGVGVA